MMRIKSKIPVVYRDEYNITFFGLQKRHPIDSEKFGKISLMLKSDKSICGSLQWHKPEKVEESTLRKFHTKEYLARIATASGLLGALEFDLKYFVRSMKDGWTKSISSFFVNRDWLVMYFLNRYVVPALKYQVGGTILAGELALKHGIAVNIGGGMHHASSGGGGGCFDVHRGNGHALDKLHKNYGRAKNITIVDIYEKGNYPVSSVSGELDQIDFGGGLVAVGGKTNEPVTEKVYLNHVKKALKDAFGSFSETESSQKPDIVFYNAGSDVLDSDPLGGFQVSEAGVAERDRLVIQACLDHGIPVVYLTSGGYARKNAMCVGNSMKNFLDYVVKRKKKLEEEEDEGEEEEEHEGEI